MHIVQRHVVIKGIFNGYVHVIFLFTFYIEDERARSVTPVAEEEKSDSDDDDYSINSNITEVSKQGTQKCEYWNWKVCSMFQS